MSSAARRHSRETRAGPAAAAAVLDAVGQRVDGQAEPFGARPRPPDLQREIVRRRDQHLRVPVTPAMSDYFEQMTAQKLSETEW